MKKRILPLLLLPLFLFSACGDWLDVVPESDIATIDTDFETYADAYAWLKSCYVFLQGPANRMNNVAFWGSDEMVADNYFRNTLASFDPAGMNILEGRQTVLAPYDDFWFNKYAWEGGKTARDDYYTAIVMCNHFITRIDKVYTDPAEYERDMKKGR